MLLRFFAFLSICTGVLSAFIIIVDIYFNPQKMRIMNIVWPVTALYAGPAGLFMYFKIGRNKTDHALQNTGKHLHGMAETKMSGQPVTWGHITKSTLHCGSGCFTGDILSEILLFFITICIFANTLFDHWLIDFIFAFIMGIIFQYFSIKDMSDKSFKNTIRAALKADTLSLICWQIGMYGWMAVSVYLIFHRNLQANSLIFWFMMQIAMILGFFTAWPVNAWLIKKGIKEPM